VHEQIKIMREGFKERRHNQFYIGSPQRATSSLLCTTCKESSTNSINCSHTINQPIPTPHRNQNPAKLINCSPQLLINFSRNTKLIPIAQTSQFLLPVEIKNPAKLINCSPQLPINFSRNTRLTPIAQTNTIVQRLSQKLQ